MKRLAFFVLGVLVSVPAMIGIARLRQFIFEPDYIVRCDAGKNG